MTAESDLGTILVDREGFALYTFTSGGEPVPCSGACAAAWPPLVLPESQDEPEAEDSISGLSAVMTEGRTQVALNGLPLYRFSGDSEAGQVNGDGIVSFGGTWRVAIPAGAGASGASSDGSGSSGSSSGGAPGY